MKYKEFAEKYRLEARYEFIFGEVVKAPLFQDKTHQQVLLALACGLKGARGKKDVLIYPFELKLFCPLKEKESIGLVYPDIAIFGKENTHKPEAVFEIVNKSSAYADKRLKFELYECLKVGEYFLVEPEYAIIEKFVYKDGGFAFGGFYSYKDVLPVDTLGLNLELKEVFGGFGETG